jgi:peroxiredoxin
MVIVLLRLALSAVFSIAGVAKFLDQQGTRNAVKNFGAPAKLTPALALLLPLAELAIAAGLLFDQTVGASAIAALVVLGLFVAAISVSLARGRTHDCHCFGQLYSRPLGWPTLARNLVFALAAAAVWWQARDAARGNVFAALTRFSLWQWVCLLLLAGTATVALAVAYQRQKRLPLTAATLPRGLPVAAPAPPFELAAYEGGSRSLRQLLEQGKPLLLVFTNPTCGPCVTLFQEIKEWQDAHSEQLTIALLSFGTIKENFVNVARNGLGQVLLQKQREVAEQYGANLTPSAVVVNPNGRIASELAAGAEEIRALLAAVLTDSGNANHERRAN